MFRNQLPPLSEILRVTGVIAIFFYGWTLVVWLWQLPSWLLSLTLSEILAIFAYAMLSALMETLVVLISLLIVTLILPPRFLRTDFEARATWFIIGALGSILFFFVYYNNMGTSIEEHINVFTICALLMAALLAFLASRLQWMRTVALWISDRLLIFLFIFTLLTVLSLPAILVRNLL